MIGITSLNLCFGEVIETHIKVFNHIKILTESQRDQHKEIETTEAG